MRPTSGSMVYWRFKARGGSYVFGYVTHTMNWELIRMGRWNGDSVGGPVVAVEDIEWKPYRA